MPGTNWREMHANPRSSADLTFGMESGVSLKCLPTLLFLIFSYFFFICYFINLCVYLHFNFLLISNLFDVFDLIFL
jgi:hypothetical protein